MLFLFIFLLFPDNISSSTIPDIFILPSLLSIFFIEASIFIIVPMLSPYIASPLTTPISGVSFIFMFNFLLYLPFSIDHSISLFVIIFLSSFIVIPAANCTKFMASRPLTQNSPTNSRADS